MLPVKKVRRKPEGENPPANKKIMKPKPTPTPIGLTTAAERVPMVAPTTVLKSRKNSTTRRMHNVGKRYIMPLLEMIECVMLKAFKDEISPVRITAAIYSVCDDQSRPRTKKAKKTAYLLFHQDMHATVVKEMKSATGGKKPSQCDVYVQLGARWRDLKEKGEHIKYVEMERDLQKKAEVELAMATDIEGSNGEGGSPKKFKPSCITLDVSAKPVKATSAVEVPKPSPQRLRAPYADDDDDDDDDDDYDEEEDEEDEGDLSVGTEARTD
jgi:hypothetical protein